MSSVHYTEIRSAPLPSSQLPPPQYGPSINYHTEYTPLVNDRYFYVYRNNDNFLERLRRACTFILLTVLLSFIFFTILSLLLQLLASIERPYTYYLFTKRWPATECGSNSSDAGKCVPNVDVRYNRWLIHGLWPEFSNNTWNQYCTKDRFNETVIDSMKTDLLRDWPNLLRGQPDDSLWSHEWNKHGTCSKLSQYDYFARTLALNRRFDIERWLREAAIVPSDTRRYSVHDLSKAIGEHIAPSSVAFHCERRRHDAPPLLVEIYVCVAFQDAQTLIPCTVESDTCHEPFYYPPFHHA